MGECSLRKPMEEECSKHCHGLFEEYERCGERIQSLDSLSLKKLQHKAVAHGLPIKTKDKVNSFLFCFFKFFKFFFNLK